MVALAGVGLGGRLVGGVEQAHAEGAHHRTSASHADPGDSRPTGNDCPPGTPTAAETAYVAHMVDHHRQAVQMAVLVRGDSKVPSASSSRS